jgi:hypothetical protein
MQLLLGIAILILMMIAVYYYLTRKKFPQIPESPLSQPITVPVTSGTSHTFSLWFNIKDFNHNSGSDKHLLSTDNNIIRAIFSKYNNTMELKYKLANNVTYTCSVDNVPLQKWNFMLVSLYDRTLDIYFDGKLLKSCVLPTVIKTNYTKFTVGGSGFVKTLGGSSEKFKYTEFPTNPEQANKLYESSAPDLGVMGADDYSLSVNLTKNGVDVFGEDRPFGGGDDSFW